MDVPRLLLHLLLHLQGRWGGEDEPHVTHQVLLINIKQFYSVTEPELQHSTTWIHSGTWTHGFGTQVLWSVLVVELQQTLTGCGQTRVVLAPPGGRLRSFRWGGRDTGRHLRTKNHNKSEIMSSLWLDDRGSGLCFTSTKSLSGCFSRALMEPWGMCVCTRCLGARMHAHHINFKCLFYT